MRTVVERTAGVVVVFTLRLTSDHAEVLLQLQVLALQGQGAGGRCRRVQCHSVEHVVLLNAGDAPRAGEVADGRGASGRDVGVDHVVGAGGANKMSKVKQVLRTTATTSNGAHDTTQHVGVKASKQSLVVEAAWRRWRGELPVGHKLGLPKSAWQSSTKASRAVTCSCCNRACSLSEIGPTCLRGAWPSGLRLRLAGAHGVERSEVVIEGMVRVHVAVDVAGARYIAGSTNANRT